MRNQLRRLRLREGDIILVHNEDDLHSLMSASKGMKGIPSCPIVVAREGIHRLSADYLKRLLAKGDTTFNTNATTTI